MALTSAIFHSPSILLSLHENPSEFFFHHFYFPCHTVLILGASWFSPKCVEAHVFSGWDRKTSEERAASFFCPFHINRLLPEAANQHLVSLELCSNFGGHVQILLLP